MIDMRTIMAGTGSSRHPMHAGDLAVTLARRAQALNDAGWTVIGSYFKKSCLHPWKNPPREQLLAWALEDFASFEANSLNLRLDGTDVIALDADFPDSGLTKRFLQELVLQHLLPEDRIFTVQGGKGCKVFFRTSGSRPRLPHVIGPICYPQGQAGLDSGKTLLEIKTDLSTVFGAYSCSDFPALYCEFPGTRYIALAAPKELPVLAWEDFPRVKNIITGLYQLFGYVSADGRALSDESQSRAFLRSCIARGVMKARRGEDLVGFFGFLIFNGAAVAAQALQDLLNNWDEQRGPEDAVFEFLPEGSSFRADVREFLADISGGRTVKLMALSRDFDVYLAATRDWLQDRIMTLGVQLTDAHEDVLSLFSRYEFAKWQATQATQATQTEAA